MKLPKPETRNPNPPLLPRFSQSVVTHNFHFHFHFHFHMSTLCYVWSNGKDLVWGITRLTMHCVVCTHDHRSKLEGNL